MHLRMYQYNKLLGGGKVDMRNPTHFLLKILRVIVNKNLRIFRALK